MLLLTSSLTDCPWKCGLFLLYQAPQLTSKHSISKQIHLRYRRAIYSAREANSGTLRLPLTWCTFLTGTFFKTPSFVLGHNFEFPLKAIPRVCGVGHETGKPLLASSKECYLSERRTETAHADQSWVCAKSPALTQNFRCVSWMWGQRGRRVEMRSNLCVVPFSPPPPPPFFPVAVAVKQNRKTPGKN